MRDIYAIKKGKIYNGIGAVRLIGLDMFEQVRALTDQERVNFVDVHLRDGTQFTISEHIKDTT